MRRFMQALMVCLLLVLPVATPDAEAAGNYSRSFCGGTIWVESSYFGAATSIDTYSCSTVRVSARYWVPGWNQYAWTNYQYGNFAVETHLPGTVNGRHGAMEWNWWLTLFT